MRTPVRLILLTLTLNPNPNQCALPVGLLSLCGAETRRALRQRWVWGWLIVCR